MAKYIYPAIFTPEDEGGYSVVYPDLKGCYTCGDTLEDGLEMAAGINFSQVLQEALKEQLHLA